MGCLCLQRLERRKKHYQEQLIRVKTLQQLKDISFTLTTHPLTHIKANLLILFTDSIDRLRTHDLFVDFPSQARRVEEHILAQQQLQKQKHKETEKSQEYEQPVFMTVNIKISHLRFDKVGVIQIQPWKLDQPNDLHLKTIMRSYFESIEILRCKSIVITQYPSFLGVHLQRGVHRLVRQLMVMKKKPQDVIFCCLNDQSMDIFRNQLKYDHVELAVKSSELPEQLKGSTEEQGSQYY